MKASKFKKGRVMVATKAIHLLGDISRDKEDFCVVHEFDGENYIGRWLTGLGFVQVKFPKKTTRKPTPEEARLQAGYHYSI